MPITHRYAEKPRERPWSCTDTCALSVVSATFDAHLEELEGGSGVTLHRKDTECVGI